MAGAVKEAERAVKAGADVIIAQGSEGGGHVGWMGSMPLIPMVVDAVGPVPVLAAGGFADGRGLVGGACARRTGHPAGHAVPRQRRSCRCIRISSRRSWTATATTPSFPKFPTSPPGQVWPGAMMRSRRNALHRALGGRERALRQHKGRGDRQAPGPRAKPATWTRVRCRWGRTSGLIHDILPACEIVDAHRARSG